MLLDQGDLSTLNNPVLLCFYSSVRVRLHIRGCHRFQDGGLRAKGGAEHNSLYWPVFTLRDLESITAAAYFFNVGSYWLNCILAQ